MWDIGLVSRLLLLLLILPWSWWFLLSLQNGDEICLTVMTANERESAVLATVVKSTIKIALIGSAIKIGDVALLDASVYDDG